MNSAGAKLPRSRKPGLRNEYRIEADTTAIILRRTDGPSLEALIDTADLPILQALNARFYATWAECSKTFYVKAKPQGRTKYLHRILFGEPDGVQIDHRDWNGLNCRRNNLRCVAHGLNVRYKRLPPQTKTGFKGVEPNKKRFAAYANTRGKKHYLGLFVDPKDAAAAVKRFLDSEGLTEHVHYEESVA